MASMWRYRIEYRGDEWASRYHPNLRCAHQAHGSLQLKRWRSSPEAPWRYLMGICPRCKYEITFMRWQPEFLEVPQPEEV